MVVPNETSSVEYAGTDSTSVFAITWQWAEDADIHAYTIVPATGVITELAQPADFTLAGAGIYTGGTLTLTGGNLPSGTSLFIESDPAQVQLTLLAENAPYDPAAIMAALDLLTREVQALSRRVNDSIQIPVAESLDGYDMVLPAAAGRANVILAFGPTGVLTPVPTGGLVPSLASFATVTDESGTLTQARQITAGQGVTITDGGPGGALTFSANAIKLPSVIQQTNALPIKPVLYEALYDKLYGSDQSHDQIVVYDPGSQAPQSLLTVAAYTNIANLCFVPGLGGHPDAQVFGGSTADKLSAFRASDQANTLDRVATGDVSGCLTYSDQEDVIYGIGSTHFGSWTVWIDPVTGGVLGHVVGNGSGDNDPPLKQNALAYDGGATKDIFWISSHEPCALSRVTHVGHTLTVATTTITGYANAGAIIFDKNGHLWVFASNATLVIYRLNLDGTIAATITVGQGTGDCYLTYDPTLNHIHFTMPGFVGVLDCTAQQVLGMTTQSLDSNNFGLAWDSVRQKLWQGNSANGITVFQM